jgi:hypothetical protein
MTGAIPYAAMYKPVDNSVHKIIANIAAVDHAKIAQNLIIASTDVIINNKQGVT